jgi:hypothetical protein
MVYNTQKHWIFGLCPSSSIVQNTKEHKASETGCFRPQVRGWEIAALQGPLERADLQVQ